MRRRQVIADILLRRQVWQRTHLDVQARGVYILFAFNDHHRLTAFESIETEEDSMDALHIPDPPAASIRAALPERLRLEADHLEHEPQR